MFAKVVMRVLFEDRSDADYYREEAENYDEDGCDKRRLLKRANELDAEELPSPEELYAFLSEIDADKPRFAEMIDVCVLWRTVHHAQLHLDGDEVKISFVMETTEPIEELEELIGDDPFFKSKVGGHVGNYCKFPSRKNSDDQLGELNVDAFVTRVTDLTGEHEWVEEDDETADVSDDESDDETMHPFYMTHEDLFGEPSGLDMDSPELGPGLGPRKKNWTIIPSVIRNVFRSNKTVSL